MNELPTTYRPGYVTARKQSNGKYKLYYTGTQNEVFPGELFYSPAEAKRCYYVAILKQASA